MWTGESTVAGCHVFLVLRLYSCAAMSHLKKRKHEFALCYTADLKDTKTIPLIKLQIKV